jgi:predicted NBD/HSP70 family sugar kinase
LLTQPELRPNEARALAALFRAGGMSRASLARELGLTRSTTGILVQNLAFAGLARERDSESETGEDDGEIRVGRPGIVVEIDGDGAFFLGAYFGVDRIDLVAIDLSGAIRATASRDFHGAGSTPDSAVEILVAMVDEMLAALPPGRQPCALNVALPGFLCADGQAYHAAILGWHGVNLARLLAQAIPLDIPILLENDANCVAVAETYRSAISLDERDDSLVVLIENGVGGGIISGGRLHRGRLQGAGEIGHMPIGEAGFVYDAVRPGRFETFVGKDALLARYAHVGGRADTIDGFLAALGAGDPAATMAAGDWAHWLARGLISLTCVLQPGRIILAGSVSALYPVVAAQIDAAFASMLVEGYPVPGIEASSGGRDGPALGAAYLLHQALLSGDPTVRLNDSAVR